MTILLPLYMKIILIIKDKPAINYRSISVIIHIKSERKVRNIKEGFYEKNINVVTFNSYIAIYFCR